MWIGIHSQVPFPDAPMTPRGTHKLWYPNGNTVCVLGWVVRRGTRPQKEDTPVNEGDWNPFPNRQTYRPNVRRVSVVTY